MLASWNWLKQYVPLEMSLEELERRLTFSGLNHERTDEVGGDMAIDLEVTSNRPDCLGHIGIAREIAVLWNLSLKRPRPGRRREVRRSTNWFRCGSSARTSARDTRPGSSAG